MTTKSALIAAADMNVYYKKGGGKIVRSPHLMLIATVLPNYSVKHLNFWIPIFVIVI